MYILGPAFVIFATTYPLYIALALHNVAMLHVIK